MSDLSNENIIHIKDKEIEYIQFKKLLEYDNIITHAYSIGTNLNFRTARPNKEKLPESELEYAKQCYKKLCNALNQNSSNIVKTNQEHTDRVQIINDKIKCEKTDGLITNKPNLILSTTNADCILLLFFDPKTKTIANVHSGWKGTLQRISIKTIRKMIKECDCKAEDIICCICPSIRKCHFEVDTEVKDMFVNEFSDLNILNSKEIMEKENNKEKWNIDTVLINKLILEKEGLKRKNIIDSGLCSVCNSNLIHSFRVEKEGYGLSTAIIALK